ncbi:MAG: tol-pal system protein YbgF [Desulfobacterales bacterium]|nr:tol-pal system protein YbgF [Desulfobacterales bacterium]
MKFYGISFIIILSLLAGCATTDDVLILDSRTSALERQNAELERQSSELERQNSEAIKIEKEFRVQAAELRATLGRIREELRSLNGRIEEMEYMFSKKVEPLDGMDKNRADRMAQLEQNISAIKDRMIRLEKYLDMDDSMATVSQSVAGTEAVKELTESETYNLAKNAYDKKDFDAARDGFKAFLKKFPGSQNADNAQFWLGEIYYSEKWYEKAILEYQVVVEKYPKGNKVPSALLKQGLSFFQLGDNSNAILILKEQLIRKYPNSDEAKIAKKKLETIK